MSDYARFQAFTSDELRILWECISEYDASYYLPMRRDAEYPLAVEIAAEAKRRGVGLATNEGDRDVSADLAAR